MYLLQELSRLLFLLNNSFDCKTPEATKGISSDGKVKHIQLYVGKYSKTSYSLFAIVTSIYH